MSKNLAVLRDGSNGHDPFRIDPYVLKSDCDTFRGHVLAMSGDVQSIKNSVSKLEDLPTIVESLRDSVMELKGEVKGNEKVISLVERRSQDWESDSKITHVLKAEVTDMKTKKADWVSRLKALGFVVAGGLLLEVLRLLFNL
jgi:hypothetical protein